MNFDRLRHIAERAEIGEHREALLAVTIPEKPGSYRRFIQLLGKRSITEFNYRYADPQAAHIFVGVQLAGGEEEKRQIIALLRGAGLSRARHERQRDGQAARALHGRRARAGLAGRADLPLPVPRAARAPC